MSPARKDKAPKRVPLVAGWKRRGPVVVWNIVQVRYCTTLQDSGRPMPKPQEANHG